MSCLDKFCSIICDEINIKSGLKYDSKLDIITSFPNYGTKFVYDTDKLAKHVLVFMITGIYKQWKQPIGYFLTCNSLSSSTFKSLVHEAIDLIIEADFRIVCIICDQSPINQVCFET